MTFLSNAIAARPKSSAVSVQISRQTNGPIGREKGFDVRDDKILRMLSQDGRISWRDLADKIGLSLTPTLRRVRRLERDGYIKGYKAILDETRILGSICVFVSITLERQSESVVEEFESRIVKIPEVLTCLRMTGNSDYLLRVVVRDLECFQRLVTELSKISGVACIQSGFAIKSVVQKADASL